MARCAWLNELSLAPTAVRSVRRILFDSNKIRFRPRVCYACYSAQIHRQPHKQNKKKALAHFCTNAGYERV